MRSRKHIFGIALCKYVNKTKVCFHAYKYYLVADIVKLLVEYFQAVRYLMRFQTEYTCNLLNAERHAAFGWEAAKLVLATPATEWPEVCLSRFLCILSSKPIYYEALIFRLAPFGFGRFICFNRYSGTLIDQPSKQTCLNVVEHPRSSLSVLKWISFKSKAV